MSSVQFSQAKDAELAWLDGEIHFTTPQTASPQSDNNKGGGGLVPVLGPTASTVCEHHALCTVRIMSLVSQGKGHTNVLVNPPRLSDFKQVVTKAGISVY